MPAAPCRERLPLRPHLHLHCQEARSQFEPLPARAFPRPSGTERANHLQHSTDAGYNRPRLVEHQAVERVFPPVPKLVLASAPLKVPVADSIGPWRHRITATEERVAHVVG